MTAIPYLDLVRVERDRLARLTEDQLGKAIPHVEGWTVEALVGHTGWVARFVTAALEAPVDEPPRRSAIAEPPAGADVLGWFAEASDTLLETLAATPADKPCITFTGPQPATWWHRRMAHEFAMHRWDGQAAVGPAEDIDVDLARDGIDEVFETFVPTRFRFDEASSLVGRTIHLHATDADGEWMIEMHEDRMEVSHGHGKGDVAARGSMSDLLLLLWSRIPPSRVEVFGDAELLATFQAAATF